MGLKAKPEVGIQFGAGGATSAGELEAEGTRDVSSTIRLGQRHLDAGAELVMIESEGITENVRAWRTDVIARIVSELGLERVMFEAADPAVFASYVKSYGPEVNLFVDHSQIVRARGDARGDMGDEEPAGAASSLTGRSARNRTTFVNRGPRGRSTSSRAISAPRASTGSARHRSALDELFDPRACLAGQSRTGAAVRRALRAAGQPLRSAGPRAASIVVTDLLARFHDEFAAQIEGSSRPSERYRIPKLVDFDEATRISPTTSSSRRASSPTGRYQEPAPPSLPKPGKPVRRALRVPPPRSVRLHGDVHGAFAEAATQRGEDLEHVVATTRFVRGSRVSGNRLAQAAHADVAWTVTWEEPRREHLRIRRLLVEDFLRVESDEATSLEHQCHADMLSLHYPETRHSASWSLTATGLAGHREEYP